MNARLTRLWAMAVKELLVILLDRRARLILIVAPILQLTLFGLATTLEVRNIDLGYVSRDSGVASERLLAALAGSPNVRSLERYGNLDDLNRAIEHRQVLAGLVIPQDLSRQVAGGGTGQIGVLLDGRRINSAQIVAGYLGEIAARTGAALRPMGPQAMPDVLAVNWYNPALDYVWFSMPGLIALIITVMVLAISLLAVSREREMGSFDEIMVLPLSSFEILVGKTIPAFLVAQFNATLYVILIPLVYGVPLHGSLGLLYLASIAYALALTGIGLSVSCLAQSQQQSFLLGFLVLVPLTMISGYASPVDNMPEWLQWLARANPIYHMLVICQGVFLKDLAAEEVWAHVWPMLAIALVTLGLATRLFRARMT